MPHAENMRVGLPSAGAWALAVGRGLASLWDALRDVVGRTVELRPAAASGALFAAVVAPQAADAEFDLERGRPYRPGHYRISVGGRTLPEAARLAVDEGRGFEGRTAQLRGGGSRACFSLHRPARALRLAMPFGNAAPAGIRLRRLGRAEYYGALMARRMRAHLAGGGSLAGGLGTMLREFRGGGVKGLALKLRSSAERPASPDAYQEWIARHDMLTAASVARLASGLRGLSTEPSFAVIVPVGDAAQPLVERSISSLRAQLYPRWRLFVAFDFAARADLRASLEILSAGMPLVLVDAPRAVDFARSLNLALDQVREDYVARLDAGDMLRPNALAEVALDLDANPGTEIVYTDEDRIDLQFLRTQPHFKPDFSRELFRSGNYLNHLTVHRTAGVRRAGGWREGFPGGEDYDLALRIFEHADARAIRHVPKVLYHALNLPGSGGDDEMARLSQLRALHEHAQRTALPATVEDTSDRQSFRLRFSPPASRPRVSIVIPTRDGLSMLSACIESIRARTSYENYEILVVDNGSSKPETLRYLEALQASGTARVLRYDRPFNYSAINNFAAGRAEGSVLALVNNDVEVISPDWLTEMVSWAVQPDVGCVGAMLYYSDDTIQHAGVVLGIGGMADHAHLKAPRGTPGYQGRARQVNNYSAVTGACLVVRRRVYEEVGGLNEADLAVAFNDVDLCLKVGAAGYRNVWTPFAELYHHESQSRGRDDTPEKRGRYLREVAYMRRTWAHVIDNDPFYSPHLSKVRPDFSLAV